MCTTECKLRQIWLTEVINQKRVWNEYITDEVPDQADVRVCKLWVIGTRWTFRDLYIWGLWSVLWMSDWNFYTNFNPFVWWPINEWVNAKRFYFLSYSKALRPLLLLHLSDTLPQGPVGRALGFYLQVLGV